MKRRSFFKACTAVATTMCIPTSNPDRDFTGCRVVFDIDHRMIRIEDAGTITITEMHEFIKREMLRTKVQV